MADNEQAISVDMAFLVMTLLMTEKAAGEKDEDMRSDIIEDIQDELKCDEDVAKVKFEEAYARAVASLNEFSEVYDGNVDFNEIEAEDEEDGE